MDVKQQHQTTALRSTLRQTFRERRKALSNSEQASAAQGLIEQVNKHALLKGASRVALYMTNDGELDTKPLIEHLWKSNIEVYLPVLHPFSDGHLLFLRYKKNTHMRANHFGILEPRLDCRDVCPLRQLDLLFTPLVAFDEQGNRLGMGGGFFDRTLANLVFDPSSTVRVVGLAHDIQKALSLPTQAWDIPLPYILTPSQLYRGKSALKSE
ncbi:5-formyltetrahydrofolate cyclo-ligase [Glaciecola siphonariae]|uniref:5-formyltetrahydrofolate cyclo-ligase n=1 Tax=Glaciecola siphonariae TaxID=521012 RepID=A0ABV9LUQ4_9ALTE